LGTDSDEFIPLHDLSDKQKEDLIEQQRQRLDSSTRFMETLYPQMLDNFKKYRSISDPIKDDLGREILDEPNIFVPYPYGIVESELPRLAGKLPRIRIAPRKDVDKADVQKRQNYLYYVFDRMKFLRTQTLWHRQFAIYGWSPLYYFWRNESGKILTKETDPITGETRLIKKMIAVYDDFWCKVIDCFDSFLQPGATSPESGDWFIFRELVSKQDLKKLAEDGVFYPEVLEYLKEGSNFSRNEDTGRTSRDDLVGNKRDELPHTWGKYELFWCIEDDKITCMLGGDVLCMVSDNPNPLQKKPVINLNLTELVSEPIGISTIEGLGGLPDKLNALTNARLKNISLQLGKVFLVDQNAQVDWENFVMSAGNLIPVAGGDLESVAKELEFSDNSLSSEREVLTSKEEMQFASGTSDYIVGVKSGARMADTATGVSTIVQEANARYGLKQAAYEADALRELVIAADAYGKVYLTDEKQVYVLGPEGFNSQAITPEDLAWEADIIIEPGSVVPTDQLSRREQLINLGQMIMQMPGIVRVDKYMQQVLESHDFRNADELIIPQEEKVEGQAKDFHLAQGENVSLSMGQPVTLSGNDEMHLAIHSQIGNEGLSPEIMMVIQEHIALHQEHFAAMQERQQIQQQMGGMNVAQPNQAQQGGGETPGDAGGQGTPAPNPVQEQGMGGF